MDLLSTAVVDINTLVATCHALKSSPTAGEVAPPGKLRSRLRRDIKRGTVAYIDALARTRRGAVDDTLLRRCRVAAEAQMPLALGHQPLLERIMASEAGALDSMAATRHDFWRLAHVTLHLSDGMAALRRSTKLLDPSSAEALSGRLRRRLRKALIAYARAALRAKAPKERLVARARDAALAVISPRGTAEAERLAAIETGADPALSVLRQGVAKTLLDLTLDWQSTMPR